MSEQIEMGAFPLISNFTSNVGTVLQAKRSEEKALLTLNVDRTYRQILCDNAHI